jgi:hypothetical protein
VPELLDDQLHLPGLFDAPPVPALPRDGAPEPEPAPVPSPPVVGLAAVDDDIEVVEVRSPLTIIIWSAVAVLAGLGTITVMLVLGPIFGTVALLAAIVAVLRRYQHAPDA